jgi:hypothetical protein
MKYFSNTNDKKSFQVLIVIICFFANAINFSFRSCYRERPRIGPINYNCVNAEDERNTR